MNSNGDKKLEIIAGPNGSGKTSFAEAYFDLKHNKKRFINPDIIAAGLSHRNEEEAAFTAGRIMLSEVQSAIQNQESFAFESTLSGKTWLPILKKASKEGYKLTIYFLFLKKPSMSLERIKQKVFEGGHFVNKQTVFRRYPRSFQNFWNLYRPLCSNWFIFDNSEKKPIQISSKLDFEKLSDSEKLDFEKYLLGKSK